MNPQMQRTSLLTVLKTNSTPFYIYDKQVLYKTIEEINNAFPINSFQLLFATMANDNPEFLKTLHDRNVGACINSIKHLSLVEKCGFTRDKIQFTSTGLTRNDMKLLHQKGIEVNFDSLGQLEEWFQLEKGTSAGIRINTGSLTGFSPARDRLGIDKADLKLAISHAKKLDGHLNGIHIYVGTNFHNHAEMLPALEMFFILAKELPELDYINIGGGVGVKYLNQESEFDLKEYGKEIKRLITNLREKTGRRIKLIFEPGRKLAAACGWFVTRVTDIKTLNKLRYIVVDASVSVFPRPFHHPDSPHRALTPFKNGMSTDQEAVIVGKTTFSKDILSKMRVSKNLEVGDIILFEQAGAYCDSMQSKFLGQDEPKSIFIGE